MPGFAQGGPAATLCCMNDTSPPSAAPSQKERRRGSLGPLPIWAWIVIAAVLAILLVILGVAVLAGGGTPNASSSPSTTPSIASPTPTPTPSTTPTPAASGPDVNQGTFDSTMDDTLSDILNSQNTSVLAQGGTFSNPVFVLAAHSDLSQNMAPDDAVDAMAFMFTPGDTTPWDLALPASTLAGYRAGPYGAYFPTGAIVARSGDGHVFSFIGDGMTITTMFMAASEDLLHG